jgi:hypothetical protein
MVKAGWERKAESIQLQVSLPVGSQAYVSIPKLEGVVQTITEGGLVVWKDHLSVSHTRPGITGAAEDNSCVTFAIGSGDYVFEWNLFN